MSTLPPQPYVLATPNPQPVVVTDINMTIGAMCRFMVKWAIAAIPAVIIIWALMILVLLVIGLAFGGIFHTIMGSSPTHF
jgi:hypothetical protein